MTFTFTRTIALAALLAAITVSPALAGTDPAASNTVDLRAESLDLATASSPALSATFAPSLEVMHVTVPDVSLAGVHYRPRTSGRWGRHMDSQSVTQIHLGFFDPEGTPASEFLIGARGGPMLDPHVQIGAGLDWSHIVDNASTVSHETQGPNGTTLTVKQDLSRASTNLFPIMAFMQFSGDDDMSIIPYFGIAGGYEVLNLSADNYQTHTSFDATYGGWGWQMWAGAGIPLSGQVRINGEAYLNMAEPGRDVTDNVYGGTYRETVKANGGGLRLGMAWGF